MKIRTRTVAVVAIVASALFAGQVFAQTPAPASQEGQPATTVTHNDPIVQKRMEVREANRQQRARTAEARQTFKQEARDARAERNQSAQDSRARAQAALDAH
ncbi:MULTISPECIES: hypothetical protein [Paraburkholderia]|uniref:DUF4148 domain-containing protein n=1 Tax=Paraburkholderia guartelaensis TaxID=2546446 RepID=A0ABU9SD38_9BURK|nr:hypothetical protein [Paraburkholderia nodosa]